MAITPSEHDLQVRSALREIVAEHGPEALSNTTQLSNLLKDLLPDAPAIARMLVAAAEDGVADELRDHRAQGLDAATSTGLAASSFARATLYDPDACAWIVGELAHALGLTADPPTTARPAPDSIAPGTPPARPTPQETQPAAELKEAVGSPYSRVRLRAVDELAELALSAQPDIAQTAGAMLATLVSDDSKAVSAAARAALARIADIRPPADDLATQTPIRSPQQPSRLSQPPTTPRTHPGQGAVEIPRRLWIILAYVLPLVGVGVYGIPVVLLLMIKRDRLLRRNAIQSLLLPVPQVPFYIAAAVAHAEAEPAGGGGAVFALTLALGIAGSVLYICLLIFCVVQAAKMKQPRIPVISRIAGIPPHQASPDLASRTTLSA